MYLYDARYSFSIMSQGWIPAHESLVSHETLGVQGKYALIRNGFHIDTNELISYMHSWETNISFMLIAEMLICTCGSIFSHPCSWESCIYALMRYSFIIYLNDSNAHMHIWHGYYSWKLLKRVHIPSPKRPEQNVKLDLSIYAHLDTEFTWAVAFVTFIHKWSHSTNKYKP
jgi:hypothetical protein